MEIFCQNEKMAAQVHLFADLCFSLVSRPPNFRVRGQFIVGTPYSKRGGLTFRSNFLKEGGRGNLGFKGWVEEKEGV